MLAAATPSRPSPVRLGLSHEAAGGTHGSRGSGHGRAGQGTRYSRLSSGQALQVLLRQVTPPNILAGAEPGHFNIAVAATRIASWLVRRSQSVASVEFTAASALVFTKAM